MELAEFIRARLDEDEAAAQDAFYEGQRWITEEEGVYRWPDDELVHMADRKADARHIARHDPARVLRDVAAKRQIIGLCETETDETGARPLAIRILHLLASVYYDAAATSRLGP